MTEDSGNNFQQDQGSDGENQDSAFHREDNSLDNGDIMVGNRDTTDYVARAERARNLRKSLTIAAVVVLVALLGFAAYIFTRPDTGTLTPAPTASQTHASASASPTPEQPNSHPNPITTSLPKDVKVTPGKVEGTVSDTAIKTTTSTLTVKGSKLDAPVTQCSVSNTTDFCFIGRATLNDKTAQVYLIKDAAHSRLWEGAKNFQQVTVPGALTAGTMEISLLENKPTNVIAIVDKSGSGYMLTMPDNDPTTLTTFATAVGLA